MAMEQYKINRMIPDGNGGWKVITRTWLENPTDPSDWELVKPKVHPVIDDKPIEIVVQKQRGRPKGSKNRPTTLKNRKTREPVKK